MTERERLVELLKNDNCPSPFICDSGCKYISSENCLAERMADYLLENGVIVLPLKIGDTVYRINSAWLPDEENGGLKEHTNVVKSTLKRSDISINEVYFTRDEAKNATNFPVQLRDFHRITI